VNIQVEARGTGTLPSVVLLPSMGRDVEDFEHLSLHLAAAGYQVLCPSPRGVGKTTGPRPATLHDLAADVLAVITADGRGAAFVAGHAFGSFVARTVAADRPDLVRAVMVLAAGPKVTRGGMTDGIDRSMNSALSREERLAALQATFFAAGNDPSIWLDGWYPEAGLAQRAAKNATPTPEWWPAGGVPVLDLRAEEDAFALGNREWRLADELGERVTTVNIPRAGHALLPEQPDAAAKAVLAYVNQQMQR